MSKNSEVNDGKQDRERPKNDAAPWFDPSDAPAYWTDEERKAWGLPPRG